MCAAVYILYVKLMRADLHSLPQAPSKHIGEYSIYFTFQPPLAAHDWTSLDPIWAKHQRGIMHFVGLALTAPE